MSFGRKRMAQGAALPVATGDELSSRVAAFVSSERALSGRQPVAARSSAPDAIARQRTRSTAPGATRPAGQTATNRKSMAVAYILWWFGYAVSAHRFYLGETTTALSQAGTFIGGLLVLGGGISAGVFLLMLVGGLAVFAALGWMILDAFLIPGMCRQANAQHEDVSGVFD